MVIFNESRITPDGKKLIIDVNIGEDSYLDDVYIESIVIDDQNSFNEFGPSSDALYEWVDDDPLIVNGNVVHKRHLRLELESNDLQSVSLSTSIFYVYVMLGGEASEDAPCDIRSDLAIRVIFDYGPIYRNTMNYVKEINNECEVPVGLIDRILKLNALELSLMAGHYSLANSYWVKFFGNQRNGLKKRNKCCNE